MKELILTKHALDRWKERHSNKDVEFTMQGMERIRTRGKKGRCTKGRHYYRNNGVTLVVIGVIVVTVL